MTQEDFDNAFQNYWGSPKINHLSDCQRITGVAVGMGLTVTLQEAEVIWARHSDSFSAGWLVINNDSEIETAITDFINANL